MADSLHYYLNELVIPDTSGININVADSCITPKPIVVNFIEAGTVEIEPVLNLYNSYTDNIAYILFILLGMISVIWYFIPERFSTIFSFRSDSLLQRTGEGRTKVPGHIIIGFFWLNFIISTSIFIQLILQRFSVNVIAGLNNYESLVYVILTLTSLLLYRFIVIYGSAIIFETQRLKRQQVTIGSNINFITGLLLVPFTIVIIYAQVNVLLYIGMAVILFLQLYRLFKTAIIGKSSTIFTSLHIILYLCTLEIVPVLVLIRLIGNASKM